MTFIEPGIGHLVKKKCIVVVWIYEKNRDGKTSEIRGRLEEHNYRIICLGLFFLFNTGW